MPIQPFGSDNAELIKSPRYGNEEKFSTGEKSVTISVWEIWNSRYKKQVSVYSKIYNDETTCIVRTHNKLAMELQSDDSVKFNGYTYSVQSVHPVKTALGLSLYDCEVALK